MKINSTEAPQVFKSELKSRMNVYGDGSLEIICLRQGEQANLMLELKKGRGETPRQIHVKIFATEDEANCPRESPEISD